jgi:hypothetical protein
MHLLEQEGQIMKESKDVMQRKIDHIYDNNILIAKEDGGAKKMN